MRVADRRHSHVLAKKWLKTAEPLILPDPTGPALKIHTTDACLAPMGTQSAEAVRAEYVVAMGEELGTAYHTLWSDVALLFRDWGEFIELFTKPKRTKLLNEVAPVFFRAVQVTFFEATVLRIARLTDPPQSVGRPNLTIQRLPKLVTDPDLSSKLLILVEKAKRAAGFCRDRRNRMLAHRDLDLAIGNSAKPVEDATIEKVRAAINALADILNALSQHYLKTTALFHFTDAPGGAVSLIQALQRRPKE